MTVEKKKKKQPYFLLNVIPPGINFSLIVSCGTFILNTSATFSLPTGDFNILYIHS